MIRIALCDDVPIQLELLEETVADYRKSRAHDFEVVSFLSGDALVEQIRDGAHFDLYILDMIMPGLNGMETAKIIRQHKDNSKIVFLTATMDYVLDSFDVDATHYLLKPIDTEKFYDVLDKVFDDLDKPEGNSILIKTVKGVQHIVINSIMYIEKTDRSISYHLTNGENIEGATLRESFSTAISLFLNDYHFALSSISTAVNLSLVTSMKGEEMFMKNGDTLYCSRGKASSFRKELNDFWS